VRFLASRFVPLEGVPPLAAALRLRSRCSLGVAAFAFVGRHGGVVADFIARIGTVNRFTLEALLRERVPYHRTRYSHARWPLLPGLCSPSRCFDFRSPGNDVRCALRTLRPRFPHRRGSSRSPAVAIVRWSATTSLRSASGDLHVRGPISRVERRGHGPCVRISQPSEIVKIRRPNPYVAAGLGRFRPHISTRRFPASQNPRILSNLREEVRHGPFYGLIGSCRRTGGCFHRSRSTASVRPHRQVGSCRTCG